MKTKYKIIIAVLLLGFISSNCFLLANWYDNANFSKMSLEQALKRKQFRVEVRRGEGQFQIKPFKFSQLYDDEVKVYFRNEGMREVNFYFYNFSEDMRNRKEDMKNREEYMKNRKNGKKPYHVSETFAAGEEKVMVLKRDEKSSPDDEYIIGIVDTTEPYPVVLGEFMIYTGEILTEPTAVGKN